MSGRLRAIRPRRRARGGFTLIELLMGIIIASLFAVALFGFFFAGVDRVRTHESQARAQMSARTTIDGLVREVRQSISPDDGVSPPVIVLSPTTLEFYFDRSRAASSVVPRPEKVRYTIVSNQLVRETARPIGSSPPYAYGPYGRREVLIEKLVAGGPAAFSAVTYKGTALPATPASTQLRDIAQISIRLRVSQKSGSAAQTLELNTDVALRNAIRL